MIAFATILAIAALTWLAPPAVVLVPVWAVWQTVVRSRRWVP